MLIAVPALTFEESAMANQPLGKGGGSLSPTFLNLLALLIALFFP
jgi:hypothetical protein